ncbi:MAG: PcfJ domain-containing protein, partial [Candidatus Pacebacteria bacterium]|nr:PcfJ domain-containing protein [Candidatus Paceibacterota bacterium]
MEPSPLYTLEKKREALALSPQERFVVHAITRSIDEVDELVRELAIDDVVSTLENGHPLNRLITTPEGELVGYIACEDFMPHEAYIKYFGTTGSSGRSLLKEIPAFIQYARQQGYTKLNFHGWNNRLNHILERYGFQRIRTDAAAGFNVDYFELPLVEQKTSDQVAQERTAAFENKYLQRIQKDYQETLATFSTNVRQYKEHELVDVFLGVSAVLSSTNGFEFGERQRAILKLKLARHFQREDTIDTNTLIDALIESPKFINTDKGSLHRLFEVHQEKTLQKIAEMRKRQAEITGDKKINPYEALFTTTSGQYYMARLLNMPHLEAESAYMNHCVGLSDSYINQMKRGDIEILSFRRAPIVDPHPYNQRLRGDVPVITIEYNLRTNVIEQMKKENDELLRTDDPFYADVIDALHQLRTTATDTGKLRDFKEIASSELSEIPVSDYHLLTEQGDVAARDYDPIVHGFIIKKGDLTL